MKKIIAILFPIAFLFLVFSCIKPKVSSSEQEDRDTIMVFEIDSVLMAEEVESGYASMLEMSPFNLCTPVGSMAYGKDYNIDVLMLPSSDSAYIVMSEMFNKDKAGNPLWRLTDSIKIYFPLGASIGWPGSVVCGDVIDYELMAREIRKLDADIVGLNEIYDRGNGVRLDEQTRILAELAGYPYRYFARAIDLHDGFYGNALLSRVPIENACVIPVPEAKEKDQRYEARCLLKAKLEGSISVLVIHFGLSSEEQKNAAETVAQNLEREKCILMGDFNVTPTNKVLSPIYEKMVDTAIKFECDKLSFPSDVPTEKIDYIFVSPDVEVVSADIPSIVASDHRPHIAEIKM